MGKWGTLLNRPHFRARLYKVQTSPPSLWTTTTCRNPAFMASDPFRCVRSSPPVWPVSSGDIITQFAISGMSSTGSPLLFNGSFQWHSDLNKNTRHEYDYQISSRRRTTTTYLCFSSTGKQWEFHCPLVLCTCRFDNNSRGATASLTSGWVFSWEGEQK